MHLKPKKWPKYPRNLKNDQKYLETLKKNDQNTLILFHIRWHPFFFLTFDNSIVTCNHTFTIFDGSLIFFLTFNLHLTVENWRTQHKNLSIAKAESNQNWNTLFLLLWVLLRVLFSSRGFGREEAYREKKRRDQRDRSIERVRD